MAFDVGNVTLEMPELLSKFFRLFYFCTRLAPSMGPIFLSGKWINYFGIVFGLLFDWAYWFMTALCFR